MVIQYFTIILGENPSDVQRLYKDEAEVCFSGHWCANICRNALFSFSKKYEKSNRRKKIVFILSQVFLWESIKMKF